jgi:hypothetical protein
MDTIVVLLYFLNLWTMIQVSPMALYTSLVPLSITKKSYYITSVHISNSLISLIFVILRIYDLRRTFILFRPTLWHVRGTVFHMLNP